MTRDQIFHIGVKWLICNQEGKYLCVKSQKGYFDIPGGRIIEGEHWRFALFRELREELCVPSDAYRITQWPLALPTERFSEKNIQLFLLIIPCVINEDITIVLNEENTEYSWETARDLYKKVDILHPIPFEDIFS